MGRDVEDRRVRVDRGAQLALLDVERRHVAGGVGQRLADPPGLGAAHAGHGHRAHGDERGVAQPQPHRAEDAEDAEERGGRPERRAGQARRQRRAAHPVGSSTRAARTLPVGVVASRAWRRPPPRSCATSRRCASAAPPAASSRRRTRTSSSPPCAGPTRAGEPLLVLAGGSNVVVADAGFAGTVVRVATRGVDAPRRGDGRVRLDVAGGRAVGRASSPAPSRTAWPASSASSGIPGSVGATPIQNVGAYGQEVARRSRRSACSTASAAPSSTSRPEACGFAYRVERLQARPPDRWVVLRRDASSSRARTRSRADPLRRARARARRRARRPRAAAPTSARPCSRCAAARAWSSTPTTPTRSAPARSSPTRSSSADAFAALERRAPSALGPTASRRRPSPSPDGRVKTSRRVAHRARRASSRATATRTGRDLHQAHARADEPRRGHDGRARRARARDRRAACTTRFGVDARARAGLRRARLARHADRAMSEPERPLRSAVSRTESGAVASYLLWPPGRDPVPERPGARTTCDRPPHGQETRNSVWIRTRSSSKGSRSPTAQSRRCAASTSRADRHRARPARPERRGQDHGGAHPRDPPAARRRDAPASPGSTSSRTPPRCARRSASPASTRPSTRTSPASRTSRWSGASTTSSARRRAPARTSCSSASTSSRPPSARRRPTPAACAAASTSRPRSCSARRSCTSTSRPPGWTR